MWEDIDTESIDQKLIRDAIAEILTQLTDRHRTVVIARHEFGMTYKEIGDRYKVSATRVSQIKSRAMRILRSDRFAKEFQKLGIPWIDNYFVQLERERRKERQEEEQQARECHQKCVEKKIVEQKERKAREKLKIVDSEIPKPEVIVQTCAPKPPYFPPFFVKLAQDRNGKMFLHVDQVYGSINRDLDPVTYDRWLAYLIDPKSTKVRNL